MNVTFNIEYDNSNDSVDEFLHTEWRYEDQKVFGRTITDEEWKQHYTIIARIGTRIVGVSKGFISGGELHLSQLIVSRDFRGQKIGTELVNRTITYAQSKKCHLISLTTTTKHDVVAFYKQFAFFEACRWTNGAFHLTWLLLIHHLEGAQ